MWSKKVQTRSKYFCFLWPREAKAESSIRKSTQVKTEAKVFFLERNSINPRADAAADLYHVLYRLLILRLMNITYAPELSRRD